MYFIYIRKKRVLYFIAAVFILALLFLTLSRYLAREAPVINPIYLGDTEEKAVALMINVDWGEDVLPEMLTVLRAKNVKATFFMSGRFAKKFPDHIRAINQDGHEIGNHGYYHPHPDKISQEANVKEIKDTEAVFEELNVRWSKLFAPPYGEHGPVVLQAAHSLDYKTIMWTIDTVDWKEPPPATIIKRVLDKADNGALILMHPKKCTLTALPDLIEGLKERNYVIKTVSAIIQKGQ